jgi:replicative DNA helicase
VYRVWFNHKVERLAGVDNEKPPYESLEKLNSGEAPKGIKTGFWELDMLTGGFIGS